MVLLASCHKGGDDGAAPDNNKLIVAFSNATVPIASVDSIVATFISGSDTVKLTGLREGSFYSFLFSSLHTSGTYQVNAKLYTAADSNGIQHMYHYSSSVNTTSNSTLVAATSKPYDLWKPCMYFYNAQFNIKFAIGQYPTDPYFEMQLPATLPFKYVYIARNLYKTTGGIKYPTGFGYVNLKASDYKGFHTNTTAFSGFSTAAAAATAKYDAADFSFELYNDINNDYAILFTKEIAVSNQ